MANGDKRTVAIHEAGHGLEHEHEIGGETADGTLADVLAAGGGSPQDGAGH